MKRLILYFFCITSLAPAQTIEQCRQRFNNYLNFNGSLDTFIKFEADGIFILNPKGGKSRAIYADELAVMAAFFENSDAKAQAALIKSKLTRHYTQAQRDSLFITIDDKHALPKNRSLPLQGIRIAIDPGHFGTTLAEAQIEQKFLYFVKDNLHPKDSVKLFESSLTFNTAMLLKHMLEEQGAQVFVTRNQANYTSFNCTYNDWIKLHKKRVLDSLKASGDMPEEKYNKLIKATDYKFFWDFFRDYDLLNRAAGINKFNPHATAIIHYNVDEKNDPWKKTTPKNYCMAFIGGGFTAESLFKPDGITNFLRLLLSDQLNRSEKLAGATVNNFNKNLSIPIATKTTATYLDKNCLATSSPGVFSRNLLLCRKINSVLVYGESLYQDNESECEQLMRCDTDLYGVTTNTRLINVAKSYYEALFTLLKN